MPIPFDSLRLVELLKQQHPDLPDIAAAMARCHFALSEEPGYTRIVTDRHANMPGAEWQFESNVVLEDPVRGCIVLDVLKDGRIGGVEFVDEIP